MQFFFQEQEIEATYLGRRELNNAPPTDTYHNLRGESSSIFLIFVVEWTFLTIDYTFSFQVVWSRQLLIWT